MSEATNKNHKRKTTRAPTSGEGASALVASALERGHDGDDPELATPALLQTLAKPYVIAPLVGMLAATVGAILSVGPAVLTVTGIVILFAIFAVWQSVRMLTGELPVPEDMALVKLGRRGALMEQKRSVLRALKDLENERDIGKIEPDDFETVALRYRNEAKGILRAMDAEVAPHRNKAEALATAHLRVKGLSGDKKAEAPNLEGLREEPSNDGAGSHAQSMTTEFSDASSETKKQGKGAIVTAIEALRRESSAPSAPSTETPAERASSDQHATYGPCGKCGTINDSDAKFCKNCAAPLKTSPMAHSSPPSDESKAT